MKPIDLINKKGKLFYATINGKSIIGKIQVEDGCIYLCQNKKKGTECQNKFGYKYSWIVLSTSSPALDDFKDFLVEDFKLIDKELRIYPYFLLFGIMLILIGLNPYLTDLGKIIMFILLIFSSYQFLNKTKFGQLLVNNLINIWS